MDYDTVAKDGAVVDFTEGPGKGKSSVRVTHGKDKKYTLKYT